LNARHYDAATATFLSVDPVFQPGNPMAAVYGYGNASPIGNSDPTGLRVPTCADDPYSCDDGDPGEDDPGEDDPGADDGDVGSVGDGDDEEYIIDWSDLLEETIYGLPGHHDGTGCVYSPCKTGKRISDLPDDPCMLNRGTGNPGMCYLPPGGNGGLGFLVVLFGVLFVGWAPSFVIGEVLVGSAAVQGLTLAGRLLANSAGRAAGAAISKGIEDVIGGKVSPGKTYVVQGVFGAANAPNITSLPISFELSVNTTVANNFYIALKLFVKNVVRSK
jgi:hypothetical protein